MHKKNIYILLFFVIQLFFVVALAETTGNLSISGTNHSIVTGLWGQTITTTTTTTTTTQSSQNLLTTTTINITTTTTTIITTTTTIITTTTTTTLPEIYSEIINISEADTETAVNSFKYKLKDMIGRFDINKMIRVSKTIVQNLIIKRELTIKDNTSTLLTIINYNGSNPIKNFIVYDNISKSLAQNVSVLDIIADVNKSIIEEDPVIAFIYSTFTSNDTAIVKYTVNKKLNKSALNETTLLVFAEDFIRPGFPLWIIAIIVIIVILLTIFIYIVIKRPKQRYGRRKQNIFTLIKEKLKRLFKKEEEVKFRYEYKP